MGWGCFFIHFFWGEEDGERGGGRAGEGLVVVVVKKKSNHVRSLIEIGERGFAPASEAAAGLLTPPLPPEHQ